MQNSDNTRKSLMTTIANTLLRYRSSKKADVKDVLMLIAAIGLLNSNDESGLALSTARRLVSTGSTK